MPFSAVLNTPREPQQSAPGRTAAEGALELLPIAAVVVRLEGRRLTFQLPNAMFRRLELGTAESRKFAEPLTELSGRIIDFLSGEDVRERLSLTLGSCVEQRRFDVTLARIAGEGAPHCLLTLLDQTAEMRTETSLRREMTTDSLTGLPNREGFGDRLEERLTAGATDCAVLVIDLDRFGRINSCLGSMAGDELLMTAARRIKGALRATDVLGRIGGDEFGVLLTLDEGRDEAEHAVRRIRDVLATPFRLSDFEIRITCAIGMAFADNPAQDAEDVIRHAQFAVRKSKETGKAEAYETRALDRARAQFAMETALRRAIDAEQLTLHYQPVCDLATGKIVAFEALARWTTEDGKIISPADFISVAEETGLIVPIGRWAIDGALRTLAEWDALAGGSCDVQMAVNISPIQLQRDHLPPVVEAALARHGLAGGRLKLELTESALIADPDRNAAMLRALKDTGASIAMDDFGTGYSNLAYLQRLPIDILKIDRSFVTDMMADRDKIAIVRAILSLAATLNMDTIAEGIESRDVSQTLAALGCTFGQGYAFSPPLPADDAYQLLLRCNS